MKLGGFVLQKFKPTQMDFLAEGSQNLVVSSYSNGKFTLSDGKNFAGPIALYKNMVLKWNADTFDIDHIELWKQLRPNLLIFGTGSNSLRLPIEIQKRLTEFGISFETMLTKNAISTHGILSTENRNAALLCLPNKE
eukprot:NODE_586_length_5672_cov_0.462229.p6 type:complete len:137 gc:universal NODE_586_length_5672_cov_0.462229:5133-4723(-)